MDTTTWRFLCSCAGGAEPQPLFYAAEAIALINGGIPNSLFGVLYKGNWYSYKTAPEWTAVAMAAALYPGDTTWVVIAISSTGHIWELRPKQVLESLGRIPNRVALTNLASIRKSIYVCGMGRVLLRREANGSWTDLSAPRPAASEGVIGFTQIAGTEDSPIYAAGWAGEIWSLTGERWQREDSPSNSNFNSVAVTSSGLAYIVGDGGVMVRGRHGSWEVVDTGIDMNLQDVCFFGGEIFVSTDFYVYRLTDAGLKPDLVEESADRATTCLKLIPARPDVLYSVGPQDIFERRAGTWRRLA